MQKMTTAVLLSCLLAPVSLAPASADEVPSVPSPYRFSTNPAPRLHHDSMTPATTQFLRAFTAYAQAVKDQGAQGVRTLAASDFSLRQGNQAVQGDKAFQELGSYMDDFPKDGFTASVCPLSISGTQAVALTRETIQTQFGFTRAWATYYRKQTWRMTPQGWKLAVIEIQDEKEFDNAYGLRFMVTPEAKDNPAKAQGRPDVVK